MDFANAMKEEGKFTRTENGAVALNTTSDANNRVYHQKAYSIVFSQSGWFVQCDKDSIHAPNIICVDVEYGKTWFLTREEAEKKLEEMKKNEP